MNREPLSEEHIEQIRLYLSGQASEDLVAELEARIKADEWFAREVENFRFLMQGLKSLQARNMRTQLKQWEQERKQVSDTQSKPETKQGRIISFRSWKTYASIAAVGLILFLFWGTFRGMLTIGTKSYDMLLAENLQEVPMPSLMRGGKAPVDSLAIWYRSGISYYAMENYEAAVRFLEKCQAQDSLPAAFRSAELELYLGVSYLHTKQAALARQTLNGLPDSGVFQYHKDWFLALSALQAQDSSQLSERLLRISMDSSHLYQQRAARLLEDLPTSDR